jgi:hypothetical protein
MIRQAFREESMSRTWVSEWHVRSFSLTSRGFFIQNSSCQAKTVNFTYYRDFFYGNCVKMCLDLALNFGDKRTGYCIMTTRLTLTFHQGIFDQKHVIHHPHYFFVSPIEDKTKSRHSDTTQVIKAELRPVLNTLLELDFEDAFKKLQKCWELFICTEGTASRVMVASRPTVSF